MKDPIFEVASANYRDEHRLFAQMIMSRGVVDVTDVGIIFKQACNLLGNVEITQLPKDCDRELAKILAEKLNSKLEPLGLRVCFQYDEYYDNTEYLILISEIDHSESLKVTGSFTPEQTELFHHWLTIMYNPNHETFGEIKIEEALNSSKIPAMGNKPIGSIMHSAQLFINQMKKENWIVITKDSYMRLHARAISELEPVLRSEEFDLPVCAICKRIVAVKRFAHKCQCENLVHKTCISRLQNRSANGKVKCPGKTSEGRDCSEKFTEETLRPFRNAAAPDDLDMGSNENAPQCENDEEEINGVNPYSQDLFTGQKNFFNEDDEMEDY